MQREAEAKQKEKEKKAKLLAEQVNVPTRLRNSILRLTSSRAVLCQEELRKMQAAAATLCAS